MSGSSQQILRRIKKHIKKIGTPLVKVGEVLGSDSHSTQGRSDFANNFLAGKPRSFTPEKINKISRFFNIDFSISDYKSMLVGGSTLMLASDKKGGRPLYGSDSVVEKASDKEVTKMFDALVAKHPDLLKNINPSSLSPDTKRLALRANNLLY